MIPGGSGGERRDLERRRDRPMDPFQQMHQQMNSMMQNFGRGQGMFDARMPDMVDMVFDCKSLPGSFRV